MGRLIKKGIAIAASLLLFVSCDDLTAPLIASIMASHGMAEYTVTLIADYGGTVLESEIIVREGTEVEISAIETDANYGFINWQKQSGSGTVQFENASQETTTIVVDDGDVELLAHFDLAPATITLVAETGGEIRSTKGIARAGSNLVFNLPQGEPPLALSAIALVGYDFFTTPGPGWIEISDDETNLYLLNNTSQNSTLTFIESEVKITGTFTAQFAPEEYDVILETSPASPSTAADHNSTITPTTAAPIPGKYLYWTYSSSQGVTASFSDRNATNPTVTISGSASSFDGAKITLTAEYRDIKAEIGPNGSINLSKYLSAVTDMEISGNYAFISGNKYEIGVRKKYPTLVIVDIRSTDKPSIKKVYTFSPADNAIITDVAVYRSTVYFGISGDVGSDVYEFSSTSLPKENPGGMNVPFVSKEDQNVTDLSSNQFYKGISNIYRYESDKPISLSFGGIGENNYTSIYKNPYDSKPAVFALGRDNKPAPAIFSISYDKDEDEGTIVLDNSQQMDISTATDLIHQSNRVYVAGTNGLVTLGYEGGFSLRDTLDASSKSGEFNFLDITGNFLISYGEEIEKGTGPKIAILDIHSENNAIDEPALVGSISASSNRPAAMAVYENFIFTMEGTSLHKYKFGINYK